jgi:hypothetical protein
LLEKKCASNLPFSEDDSARDLERVRLAIVKTAGGDLVELRRQVGIANRDWRDVFNLAEYPEALGIGLVVYSKLDERTRKEVEARDRQRYLGWLRE